MAQTVALGFQYSADSGGKSCLVLHWAPRGPHENRALDQHHTPLKRSANEGIVKN